MNYYNEIDPYAAQWLRNLIEAGLIPQGVVDERSIAEVNPEDLSPYTQCHFFAGIGGWSYALALADWPFDRPVWTGSCPCQPFSCAGKRRGISDSRHLWPEFFRLIRDYNRITEYPVPTVLGEQVASKDGLRWLDGVQTDLEGAGYTFGAADLCAAGVGAPHIRQRLYWVADCESQRCGETRPSLSGQTQWACQCGDAPGMGNPDGSQLAKHPEQSARQERQAPPRTGWSDCLFIPCRDGKARRVSSQPGDVPLAHGIPRDMGRMFPGLAGLVKGARRNRFGRLKGYGNAIVPQVAAEFIKAYTDARL